MTNHTISFMGFDEMCRGFDCLIENSCSGFTCINGKLYNISDEHLEILNKDQLKYKVLENYEGLSEEDKDNL